MRNRRNQRSQNEGSRTRYGKGIGTYSSETYNRNNYNNRHYGTDRNRENQENARWGRSETESRWERSGSNDNWRGSHSNDNDNDYGYQGSSQHGRYNFDDRENRWDDEDSSGYNTYGGNDYGRYDEDSQRSRRYQGRGNTGRYTSSRNEYAENTSYGDRDRDYGYGYSQDRGYTRERNYPSQEGDYTGRGHGEEYWDRD